MGNSIAALFVNISVKGGEQAGRTLTGVRSGMKDLTSTSLEAKAGILAALYAVQQLTSGAAKQGTELMKYATITGFNVEQTGKWITAMRSARVEQSSVLSSLKGVQDTITKINAGGAAPAHIGWLTDLVNFDQSKVQDISYVAEKLVEYSKAQKNAGMRNMVLGEWGFNEDMIQGASRLKGNVGDYSADYSEKQIKALDAVGLQWTNLEIKIQKAFAGFTAKHGGQLAKDIGSIADQFFRMADSMDRLATKAGVFNLIGKAFEGWGIIFKEANEFLDRAEKSKDSKDPNEKNSSVNIAGRVLKDIMTGEFGEKMAAPRDVYQGLDFSERKRMHPKAPPVKEHRGHVPGVKQENTFNVGPGQDPQQYADAVQPHLDHAARQMFGQVQVS